MGAKWVGEMLSSGFEESKCCIGLGSILVRTCCQSNKCLDDHLLGPSHLQYKAKLQCQLILDSRVSLNTTDNEEVLGEF